LEGLLVSIVTTSYNQAPYLEETLESIRAQDYPQLEHLVIDDGSTDGSHEILRRHAGELGWAEVQENRGQVHALNRAFSHARGDVLAFVNGDDTLLPGAVSRVVTEFERANDALLVYGDMLYTDDDSRPIGKVAAADWDPARSARTGSQFAPQPASFWTRRAWEVAGPFNERAWSLFDEEFFLRVATAGPVVRVDEPLATFRLHGESKSMSRHEQMAQECIRFADDFWGGDAPAPLQRYARSGRATYYRRAALNLAVGGDRSAARRLFLRSLALSPRGMTAKQASRLVRTLAPRRRA
jgi:glycosyltransferase involved in cell wall biosynthesis